MYTVKPVYSVNMSHQQITHFENIKTNTID